MSIENEIAGLTQSTTDLLEAVNTKKSTLDTAVSNAQTAVTDATSQVSLAAAEKVGAQTARDTAETFKDQAYTYSQSAASAVAYQDLTAIAESKAETAVDVFVYDTRKDSDGGAWRKRTQGTSWYNETLNTATRGSRKEFPAVAVIVAETGKVTIYDGDDPSLPMWMVFNSGGSTVDNINHLSTPSANIYTVSGMNGIICPCGAGGYMRFDFIKDVSTRTNASDTSLKIGGISERNNGRGQIVESSIAIVNGLVNDVAMTVLPDAPIDPATGLPIPTIAVATDGGVSVIKDDGSVVDITGFNDPTIEHIAFDADGNILTDSNFGGRLGYYPTLPSSDITYNSPSDYEQYSKYSAPYTREIGAVAIAAGANTFVNAGNGGADIISRNPTDKEASSVAYITSEYNTGWMNGDTKLATLSDTDDTDLVGSELVTNGTFDTDTSGWTLYGPLFTRNASDSSAFFDANGVNSAKASQVLTGLVIGSQYLITADVKYNSGEPSSIEVDGLIIYPNAINITPSDINFTTKTLTFTATSTEHTLSVRERGGGNNSTCFVDNISVRLVEADRSVNNNGLQVFGTVQKSPVATGADLVAYLPTGGGRLEQPYNSDLDFGTGDFCYMGWGRLNNTSSRNIVSRQHPYGAGIGVNAFAVGYHTAAGSVRVQTGSGAFLSGYAPPSESTWTHVCAVRKDGVLYIYVNGELQSSHSFTNNVDNPDAKVYAGSLYYNNTYTDTCQAALLKISGTAPTAEQVAKIYRDEKVLFQENAQATLHGTSDAVTALAYDTDTTLLHVGTSSGRSVFQGLRRVDNTTDAVGTAISASNGLIVEE